MNLFASYLLSSAMLPTAAGVPRYRVRTLGCAILLAFICAAGYASDNPAMPPLGPDLRRVVIYRRWHYPASGSGLMVAING